MLEHGIMLQVKPSPLRVEPCDQAENGTGPAWDAVRNVKKLIAEEASSHPARTELQGALTSLGEILLTLPPWVRPEDPVVSEVRTIIRELAQHDSLLHGLSERELERASAQAAQGWRGLLASMLSCSALEWKHAPQLSQVPDWLYGDYVGWIFRSPETTAAALLPQLEQLHGWLLRNPGSAAVRGAADAWLKTGARIPSSGSPAELLKFAELRGAILTRLFTRGFEAYEPLSIPRHGRPLRVAVVTAKLENDSRGYSLLATMEHWAAWAFETTLYCLELTESTAEQYARCKVAYLAPLGGETTSRVETLRNGRPDVVLFWHDLTGPLDEITQLALHRTAPLQVSCVNEGSTSARIPSIDLELRLPTGPGAPHTARDLVVGAHTAYRIPPANQQPQLNRELLGLPDRSLVLGAVVGRETPSDDVLDAWVRSTRVAPDARLVIAYGGPEASAFCQQVDRHRARLGCGENQILVFPANLHNAGEVRALLALTDIFLDGTQRDTEIWLLEAIASAHVPLSLRRTGPIAALFDQPAFLPLQAADGDAFVEAVKGLMTMPQARDSVRARLEQARENGELACLDTLAASDSLGLLLNEAFDHVCESGRTGLWKRLAAPALRGEQVGEKLAAAQAALERLDLDLASDVVRPLLQAFPTHSAVRSLYGRILHARGDAATAAHYHLAVVQAAPSEPQHWLNLAHALSSAGQKHDAISALETGLRLDPTHRAGWQLLHDLALAAGAGELVQEAGRMLEHLDPPAEPCRPCASGFTG